MIDRTVGHFVLEAFVEGKAPIAPNTGPYINTVWAYMNFNAKMNL